MNVHEFTPTSMCFHELLGCVVDCHIPGIIQHLFPSLILTISPTGDLCLVFVLWEDSRSLCLERLYVAVLGIFLSQFWRNVLPGTVVVYYNSCHMPGILLPREYMGASMYFHVSSFHGRVLGVAFMRATFIEAASMEEVVRTTTWNSLHGSFHYLHVLPFNSMEV